MTSLFSPSNAILVATSSDSIFTMYYSWLLVSLVLSPCELSSTDANISRRLRSSNEISLSFITVLRLELVGVLTEISTTLSIEPDFARPRFLLRFRFAFFSARLIFLDLRCARAGRAGLVTPDGGSRWLVVGHSWGRGSFARRAAIGWQAPSRQPQVTRNLSLVAVTAPCWSRQISQRATVSLSLSQYRVDSLQCMTNYPCNSTVKMFIK